MHCRGARLEQTLLNLKAPVASLLNDMWSPVNSVL